MEPAKETEKVNTEIWKETGSMPCKPSGEKCFVLFFEFSWVYSTGLDLAVAK